MKYRIQNILYGAVFKTAAHKLLQYSVCRISDCVRLNVSTGLNLKNCDLLLILVYLSEQNCEIINFVKVFHAIFISIKWPF